MLTREQKELICTFQVCVQLHTFFYYSPSSRYNMTEPVHNRDLIHACQGYAAHLDNYFMDYFSSESEGQSILKRINDDVISGKKYLIPGYLTYTAKDCAKKLLSSPYRSSYDFVGFIDGYLIWMPDDYLKKSIYGIAKDCGLRVL